MTPTSGVDDRASLTPLQALANIWRNDKRQNSGWGEEKTLARIELELFQTGERIDGRICGPRGEVVPVEGLRLQPTDQLEIRGKCHTLGHLCNSLRNYDHQQVRELFDTAGQLAIGRYLFAETLGRVDAIGRLWLRESDEIQEIRVVTQLSFLRRLPWNLLAREHSFLAANGWAFCLATTKGGEAPARLALRPKVLVALPEPPGYPPTGSAFHLATLRERLRVTVSDRYAQDCLLSCKSWEETRANLVKLAPDIFYFYGHGEISHDQPRLVFENLEGEALALPMLDFAQFLAALEQPPLFVYLNCCSGDASGGLLDAGWQLHEKVPAVLANRTQIPVEVAQVVGREILLGVLVDGMAPHTAMARCLTQLPDLGLSFDNPGWMTSVLHARYSSWDFPGLAREDPLEVLEAGGQFPAERSLGRDASTQEVRCTLDAMLAGDLPPWRIFCWTAAPGQGSELFHDDLLTLLEDIPTLDHLKVWRLAWPPWMRDPADHASPDVASLRLALCECFEVETVADIPAQLARDQRDWLSGATRLHYLRLPAIPIPRQPVPLPRPIDALAFVLRTLYQKIAPAVRPPAHLVIGVPLVTQQTDLPRELGQNLAQLPDYAKIWRSFALPSVELPALEQAIAAQVLDDIRADFARHLWQLTGGSYEELLRLLPRADELSEEFRFEKMLAS